MELDELSKELLSIRVDLLLDLLHSKVMLQIDLILFLLEFRKTLILRFVLRKLQRSIIELFPVRMLLFDLFQLSLDLVLLSGRVSVLWPLGHGKIL